MTKKEKARREQLKLDIVKHFNFNESRYAGIYYSEDKNYRLKFKTSVIRLERKVLDRWMNVRSGYYKNIRIVDNKIIWK